MDIRELDEGVAAAPHIFPGEVAELKRMGYRYIVNNSPDGEEPWQPAGAEIAAAAAEMGLGYAAVPVGREPLSAAQLDALDAALNEAEGPALLYCRSGTRSTTLWALAQARAGRDPRELIARAARAGYDLSPYEPMMRQLAQG